MDPSQLTIADLFVPDLDGEPAAWVDISFVILILVLHLIFTCKFTTFSLSYLNAKCAERKSGKTWTTSHLYARAIHLHHHHHHHHHHQHDHKHQHHEHQPYFFNTDLWTRSHILRYTLRMLLFLCSWVSLFCVIILCINLIFEYVVTSISYPEYGSFMALILLPSFIFVIATVLRFLFYGAMATWTLNVDVIANQLALEFKRHQIQLLANKLNKEEEDQKLKGGDEDDDANNPDEDDKDKPEDDNDDPPDPDEVDKNQKEKQDEDMNQSAFEIISSPYWMAFWWRLLIVISCIVFTLLALPTVAESEVSYFYALRLTHSSSLVTHFSAMMMFELC